METRWLLSGLLLATFVLAGCSDGGDEDGGGDDANDVGIHSFMFEPQSITVEAGESVRWTNHDPSPHTATADDGSFGTGNLAQGESDELVFSARGSHPYHCAVHPSMTGTVVVV